MAARVFKLPDIDDLTKEQDAIIDLPLEGQYLIVGGPGTGKSVVALMRARRLSRVAQAYVCLAYNKTLLKSNEQLFGEGLQSQQWQAWFNKVYKQIVGHTMPRIKQEKNDYQPIHWEAVSRNALALQQPEVSDPDSVNNDPDNTAVNADSIDGVNSVDSVDNVNSVATQPKPDEREPTSRDTLIIDEGQDMPPQFYQSLVEMGFENFFIVADQNQQITDECSSIKQLRAIMYLSPEDVFKLTINWRNSYEIAVFSRHFYTDEATPPPALPDATTRSTGNVPLLYAYKPDQFGQVIRRILIQAKDHSHKLIGIICPNNSVLTAYHTALIEQQQDDPTYQDIRISCYSHGKNLSIDFGQGGIFLINAHSCKGLEFDSVFLADIDEHYAPGDIDVLQKRFYVMASRARDKLFLLRQDGSDTTKIDRILPTDNSILIRR